MQDLSGKCIVITGACGGIGQASARALAAAGATLVLIDRDAGQLTSLQATLGEGHLQLAADITLESDRRHIADLCASQPVDCVINAAGVNLFASLSTHTESDIERIISVNLSSQIALTRQLLPVLLQRPAAEVIHVGSTLGAIGMPGYSVYCASKAGLRGFSEALARELMDTNVSVRYFAPRGTRTALNDDRVVAMNAELGNAMDTPEQVAAQLVVFLSQDGRSRFLGWPEKLYVLVNALLPSIVDRSVRQQLSTIKRYF